MKKLVLVAVAVCLAACGPSGGIAGVVRVEGGDTSLVTVTLTGAVTQVTAPDAEGRYVFEGVPDGVYLIEAVGPSTLEARLATRAEVMGGHATVPELRFTGVGQVSGRVSCPNTVAGAEVFVTGMPIRQNVAEDGTFTLQQVPAGEQTLVATRAGYEPTYVRVNVPYNGSVQNQVLALTEVAHGPGEIAGRAYFFDGQDHAGITVRVEGTQIQTVTDAQGDYTLRGAPLGYVTLVAEAPGYEPARLMNVLSASGGTLRAPDLRLSYSALRFRGMVTDFAHSPSKRELLFVGQPEFGTSYYLYWLDLTAADGPRQLHRYGAQAPTLTVSWREDGRRAAFRYNGSDTLYALDLDTNAVTELTQQLHSGPVKLAAERLFFLERGMGTAPVLAVWDFTSGQTTRLGEVHLTAADCPPDWNGDPFVVSSDGEVAWFSPATPNDAVLVWDGAAREVNAGTQIECIDYFGGGTTLVGLRTSSSVALYNLEAETPKVLAQAVPGNSFGTPPFILTGDGQYAVYLSNEPTGTYLRSVDVAGTGASRLLASNPGISALSEPYIARHPSRAEVAFRAEDLSVVVMRADGTEVRRFTGPAGASAFFGWSPGGAYFLHGFSTDRYVFLSPTTTYTPTVLGQTSEFRTKLGDVLAFSPQDTALWFKSGSAPVDWRFRLVRLAGAAPLETPFVSPGMLPDVRWSPNGSYALLSFGGTDRIVDVEKGTHVDLGRIAYPFSDGATLFTGDESRLVFSEEPFGDGRTLCAAASDPQPRHVADGDGTTSLFAIPGSPRVYAIDASNIGEPRGIYTLMLP